MVTTGLRMRLFGVIFLCVLNVPTSCSGSYCTDPGLIANGHRSLIKDDDGYEGICCQPGTSIIYGCHGRKRIEGRKVIHCTDDGTWTHSTPICDEYPCKRFDPGDNIHVDIFDQTNHTAFPEGTVIHFQCESGYHMRGLSTLLCVATGWFGRPPKCEQHSCSRFDPGPNLHVDMFGEPNITTFPHETVINFYCDEDHTLQGSTVSKCQYGRWVGGVPTCQVLQICPEPSLEFGDYIGACCMPGSIVTFFCEGDSTEFYLQGVRSAACLPTGVWSEPIPTCKRKVCSRFETEPHLYVHEFRLTNDSVFPDGTIVTYACETGYSLTGPSSSICSEGVWLGRSPMCERPTCSRFETEPPLYVKEFQVANASVFNEGTIVTYGCKTGYVLFGPRSSLCKQGVWLGGKQKCEEVKCGLLETPLKGYMTTTHSTTVGAKANFLCNNGYMLVGSAERMCLEEGQWDGTPARCFDRALIGAGSRVLCPYLATPDHGFLLKVGHFVPGRRIAFGCNPGYKIHGGVSLQCLPNGTWSSTPPTCISRYYFDEIEAVREKIEDILTDVEHRSIKKFIYLVFDNLSTVGTDNFRHIISLAKAITKKVFKTSHRYYIGIVSVGRNATIVLDPMEPTSLNVTLQRLDQISYTYGTATSSTVEFWDELHRRPDFRQRMEIRRGLNPIFAVVYGRVAHYGYSPGTLGKLVAYRGRILSIGVRGDSEDAVLRTFGPARISRHLLILRDYNAMKLVAEDITVDT